MADKGWYQVAVYTRGDTLARDAKKFPFGEWSEIGYWLDECGYNDSRYELRIMFAEERQSPLAIQSELRSGYGNEIQEEYEPSEFAHGLGELDVSGE